MGPMWSGCALRALILGHAVSSRQLAVTLVAALAVLSFLYLATRVLSEKERVDESAASVIVQGGQITDRADVVNGVGEADRKKGLN